MIEPQNQATAFSRLNPCVYRKGSSMGTGEYARIIIACNGFEVTVNECSTCSGKPKTKMTFRQFLNQKEKGLSTILRRKMQTEPMTNDEIVDRLNIVYKTEPEMNTTKVMLGLLLILALAISLLYVVVG